MRSTSSRWIVPLAAASMLCGGLAAGGCGEQQPSPREEPSEDRLAASRGPVLPLSERNTCEVIPYEGRQTRLYSDRPYHTQQDVAVLEGRVFCRSTRHGDAIWLLEVQTPTLVHAFASEAFQLEDAGWQRVAGEVTVAAAGTSFDGIYAQNLEPGRYLLHHGHVSTAIPIFWDPSAARVAAIAATRWAGGAKPAPAPRPR